MMFQNTITTADGVPRYGTGSFGEGYSSLAPNLEAQEVCGIERVVVLDENAGGQRIDFDSHDALPPRDLLLKGAEEGSIVPSFWELKPQRRRRAMDDVGSALIFQHEESAREKAVSSMPWARDSPMTARARSNH